MLRTPSPEHLILYDLLPGGSGQSHPYTSLTLSPLAPGKPGIPGYPGGP